MSNIIWKKASEVQDFSKRFLSRQDFTLYGTIEAISKDDNSVKVKLFEKDKEWQGVWFGVTEDFNVEALKESEATLLTFTAKIETFLNKNKHYITKVTLTNWTEAEEEPESNLLVLENLVYPREQLSTDQKGLDLFTFEILKPGSMNMNPEYYHIRWYDKDEEAKVKAGSIKRLEFKLGLTKYQITEDGTRVIGSEPYSYEKDGQTISGERPVYRLCLTLESIEWSPRG